MKKLMDRNLKENFIITLNQIYTTKGMDIINWEYPPGVFLRGPKFSGKKIRGHKFLGESLRGLKSIQSLTKIFSKYPFSWKLQIQISQKSLQFQKSEKPISLIFK